MSLTGGGFYFFFLGGGGVHTYGCDNSGEKRPDAKKIVEALRSYGYG
jgi:hypothetical protein